MKPNWFDWAVYRLFFWRWNRLLTFRPELREMLIANLKAYDVLDNGQLVQVHIERIDED